MSGKLKVTIGMYMFKYGCDLLGPGTLKSALPQEKIDELPHVVIIVPMKWRTWGKGFHILLTTKQHYIFCKNQANKQHQADIWFKEQQFLVLKGVKRRINIINGSLAE